MEVKLLTEGEVKAVRNKLTPRQYKFTMHYIMHMDPRRAADEAGYGEELAYSKGYKLLRVEHVKAYVGHLLAQRHIENEVRRQMVIEELARIAFVDPGDLMEIGSLSGELEIKDLSDMGLTRKVIKKLKINQAKPGFPHHGNIVEIELHDKIKALTLLGKSIGMFSDKEQPVKPGADQPAIETTININHRRPGQKLIE